MGGQVVLVIEGDPSIRQVLRDIVEEIVGAQALLAADGEVGLQVAREARPDLVLLAMRLAGVDGYEVARRLKADPATGSITIVAVTTQYWYGRCPAMAAGCDDCIQKPFTVDQIADRVRYHLTSRSPIAAA